MLDDGPHLRARRVQRHPRAQTLMAPELWDCVNEDSPFGSDEGADAYYENRAWRSENPKAPLVDCIAWTGDESQYSDAFTFDATVIATVLGQLVDKGRIELQPITTLCWEGRANW
jgi:hypothetical protein